MHHRQQKKILIRLFVSVWKKKNLNIHKKLNPLCSASQHTPASLWWAAENPVLRHAITWFMRSPRDVYQWKSLIIGSLGIVITIILPTIVITMITILMRRQLIRDSQLQWKLQMWRRSRSSCLLRKASSWRRVYKKNNVLRITFAARHKSNTTTR